MTAALPPGPACRICGGRGLTPILDFGRVPLTAQFRPAEEPAAAQRRYPLNLDFCPDCALLQVRELPPPPEIFNAGYPYYSSMSEAYVRYAEALCLRILERTELRPGSRVIELASNDGYLLQHFAARGMAVLGVDPSEGPARVAHGKDIPTRIEFFDADAADRIVSEWGQADVVIACNVIAHVEDIHGFVAGMAAVLKPGGTLVIEIPWVGDVVANAAFDTIYHEHIFYYTLHALQRLLERHGLKLLDLERTSQQGGGLRLYASDRGEASASIEEFLQRERQEGLAGIETYRRFAAHADALVCQCRAFLADAIADGRRVAAYGAAAKGVMFLHRLGDIAERIEWVADKCPTKQGRKIPGLDLSVVPPARLYQDRPDLALVLAWNLMEEIRAEHRAYLMEGGKFIQAVPAMRLFNAHDLAG